MKKVITNLTILLVYLTIILNITRFEIAGRNLIDIPLWLFLVTGVVSIAIIITPLLRRQEAPILLFLSLIVYLSMRVIAVKSSGFDQNDAYQAIIEFCVLSITILLTNQLGHNLSDVENTLKTLLFPKLDPRIYGEKGSAEQIANYEFVRGRRNKRPISAMVIEPYHAGGSWPDIPELQHAMDDFKKKYAIAKLLNIISNQLRLSDLVIDMDEQGKFIIICPETSSDQSLVLLNRLQTTVKAELGVELVFGIASFPEDGQNLPGIREKAESNLRLSLEASSSRLNA